MITHNSVELRNLQEQVFKNKDDIEWIINEEGTLNQFGLKVVAEVEPDVEVIAPIEGSMRATTNGNSYTIECYHSGEWGGVSAYKAAYNGQEGRAKWGYGDTVAVLVMDGTTITHYMKTLTRENTTQANDYWFNIGIFPRKGDPGVDGTDGTDGEDGADGIRGTRWTTGNLPTSDVNAGDYHLQPNGNVDIYTNGEWIYSGTNIKGPAGEGSAYTGSDGIVVNNTTHNISADTTVLATREYADEGDDVLSGAISTETTRATDAESNLQSQISTMKSIGRFLALWDASTGTFTSTPPVPGMTTVYTYAFKSGDYYRVSVAGNKTLDDSSMTTSDGGETWTYAITEDSSTVAGDIWYFDGSIWRKQAATGDYVADVQVNGTSVVISGIANVSVPTNNNQLTNGAGYITNYNGAVRHDMAQSLSTSAKTQARTNIGAGVPVEVEF